MTRDQAIALLQEYIETKPEHRYGLCWWLGSKDRYLDAYRLVGTFARLTKPSWAQDLVSYVDEDRGPTPKRLQLAQDLLKALQDNVIFIQDNQWTYHAL